MLAIDVELARGRIVLPEVQQRPKGVIGDLQRVPQIVAARPARRDVDPEERLALAQRRDPLSLGWAEALDDLRHRRHRGYGGAKTASRTAEPRESSRTK